MGTKYEIGESVWVPAGKVGGTQPFALVRRTVQGQDQRSVLVDGAGSEPVKVSSRLVHRDSLGFLVIRIGDLSTERSLLDPLAKSILQYLRLLVPDDIVHSLSIRTPDELAAYMATQGSGVSHTIVVGHGTGDSLVALPGSDVSAQEFIEAMGNEGVGRCLISAACKSGREAFAGAVSRASGWQDVVAPHGEVHGAAASLYIQLLLHSHLVHGHEFKTSARRADAATKGIKYRHWRNGNLVPA